MKREKMEWVEGEWVRKVLETLRQEVAVLEGWG
jgi:hypothetical protein